MTDEDRFWSKVDIRGPDDCWPWKAGRFTDGYGAFYFAGQTRKAHRMAFEYAGGISDGLVCHRCDNRPCCNPAHLFLGTPLDNMRDKMAKGRHRGAHRGSEHHLAKLTEDDVRAIRSSGSRRIELAAQYGVSAMTIGKIIRREKWKHVQ